jgi:hypothetical protein
LKANSSNQDGFFPLGMILFQYPLLALHDDYYLRVLPLITNAVQPNSTADPFNPSMSSDDITTLHQHLMHLYEANNKCPKDTNTSSLTARVVVEGKLIDSAGGNTSKHARGGDRSNVGAECLRGHLALKSEQVGAKTSDVR